MTDTFYQCYYTSDNGDRCKKQQYNYWCSEEHQAAWDKKQFGKRVYKRMPTNEERAAEFMKQKREREALQK